MSSTSYKAKQIADELAADYRVTLSSLTLVQSFDSSGNPTIALGAGVAGGANAFIVVKPIDWALAKDIFGNSALQFSPHVIQLCTEANYAATTDNVADTLTAAQIAHLVFPIARVATQFEWYQTATGTAPTVSGITAANLKVTKDNDLYWNVQASS